MNKKNNDVKKKKRHGLALGAHIVNITSLVLAILWVILIVLKVIGIVTFEWLFIFIPLMASIAIGLLWAMIAMAITNVRQMK